MANEKDIFLEPDENVTNVLERLKGITVQRVNLIVPQTTEMRGPTQWRLLYDKARGMSKRILVISADRQVRAVAKSVGFDVQEPRDVAPLPRKVPPSKSSSRNMPDSRFAPQSPPQSTVQQGLQLGGNQETRQREPESKTSQVNETITRGEMGMPSSPAYAEDDDNDDNAIGFDIDPSIMASRPPSRPFSPYIEEVDGEEIDSLQPDYEEAHRIQTEWMSGQAEQANQANVPVPEITHRDIFEMEEIASSPLPEQLGSTYVQYMEDDAPDVSNILEGDAGSQGIQIEPLDDLDDEIAEPEYPARQWPATLADEPDNETPLPRLHDMRARSSRSGRLSYGFNPDLDDPGALAPIEERPTTPFIPPPLPARQSGKLPAAKANTGAVSPPSQRSQQPLQPLQRPMPPLPQQQRPLPPLPQQQRNVAMVPASPQQVTQAPSRAASQSAPTPRAPKKRGGRKGKKGNQRGSGAAAIILISLFLLFLAVVGYFFFSMTAEVTLTVPTKTVSLSKIKLTASTNQQQHAQDTVASQVLTYDATASDSAPATGSVKVGNVPAKGTVVFTNHAAQAVDIPTNTIVSTSAGAGSILFATLDNAFVPAAGSIPIPVVAQVAGIQGNVGANTIVVIPADSLTSIAQSNTISTSALNLTITNPGAFKGGGATPVPAATSNDLAALKLKLHGELQTKVNDWLKSQIGKQDVRGTTMPDVLGSANPLAQEVFSTTNVVNQPLKSATIQGTLTLQVKVLVVRYADMLAGARQQLNTQALKQQPAYSVLPPSMVTATGIASISSKNGTVLTITLNAAGQAVLYVNTSDLSKLIAGKTKDQAISEVSIPGVEVVQISVTPAFLNLLPFRPENIHITLKPATNSNKNGVPNG